MKASKIIFSIIVILLIAVSSVILCSCSGANSSKREVTKDSVPVLDSITITRPNSTNTDTTNTVCVALTSDGTPETIVVSLNFTNKSGYEIYSFKIGEKSYSKENFKNGATPEKVSVEYGIPMYSSGTYTLEISNVIYSTKRENKTISNLTNNSVSIKVAPTFDIKYDVSMSDDPTYTRNKQDAILFMSAMDCLPSSDEMNAIAKSGQIFCGWYNNDKYEGLKYDSNSLYDFYSDITLYAKFEDEFTYKIDIFSGTVTITGLTDAGKKLVNLLVIPDTIESCKVTAIGSRAFEGNTSIISVTLNQSLIQIGVGAFKDCTRLSTIIFNDNLEIISGSAFSNCKGLSTLSMFPESLTTIGNNAFEYCGWNTRTNNIKVYEKTLIIPNTLQSIGNAAFYNSSFKKVYFISNNTAFGTKTVVNEKNDYNAMGEKVFYYSNYLEEVYTSASINDYYELIEESENGIAKIPNEAFAYCEKLAKVSLAEGLKTIGSHAFITIAGNMAEFTELKIPNSLEYIGYYSFANVPLEKLTFKDETDSNLNYIDCCAFQCASFSGELYINAPKLANLGLNAFYGCSGITEIFLSSTIVPNLVEDTTAYVNGMNLNTHVKFYVPSSVLSSYRTKWNYAYSILGFDISNVSLSDSIFARELITVDSNTKEKISYEILDNTAKTIKITNIFGAADAITIPDVVVVNQVTYTPVEIGSYVSASNTLKSVRFLAPQNIVKIDEYAFFNNTNLKTFTSVDDQKTDSNFELFSSLTEIGNYAFLNTSVNKFVAPLSLTKIGYEAFRKCSLLQVVKIKGNSGTNESLSIQANAFADSGVDTVALGSRVVQIGSQAFGNCQNLATVVMEHLSIPTFTQGFLNSEIGIFGKSTTADIWITATLKSAIQNNTSTEYITYKGYTYKQMSSYNWETGKISL